MCGIAGILDLERTAASSEALVGAMLELIAHRGPDDAGVLVDGPCVLGHRRLSIIDLSPAGHQPMASADGRLWITYNGEVYNYLELRAALEELGRTFRTETDTEVLLQAYEEWGEGALDRLNGMFAFAIWDRQRQSLFCARDRFGVKPFYYAVAEGRFRFASEIKALFADPALSRAPNDERVLDYLAWSSVDHTSDTMFAAVSQLPAGSWLRVDEAAVGAAARWYVPRPRSLSNPPEAVRGLLESAVELRLRSDVPVGVALSGGMDSSSVLAAAAAIERGRGGEIPESFSSRSSVQELDEFRYAEPLLESTGSRNSDHLPSGEELVEDMDSFLWHLDEPIHLPSAYAHRKLLELVRSRGIVVLLEGSGGDEALSGYHHVHYPAMLLSLLRTGRLTRFVREVRARREVLGVSYGRTARDILKLLVSYRLRPPRPPGWIRDPARVPRRARPTASLVSHQHFALERQPLPLHNRIGDRNSMALSIEARCPFLDFRLVEAGLGLDVPDLLQGGATKWVLREAMRDLLPAEIVDRATKQGFSADEIVWMHGPLGDDLGATFSSESFGRRPYFDQTRIMRLLGEHRAGTDHSAELWRAYSVEHWLRLFVDPPTLVAPARPAGAPDPVQLDPESIVRLDDAPAHALTA
jgi:asparagine synthase (glutamine-hydrolysing)